MVVNNWHAWALAYRQYKQAVDFLNEIPEIETFLYPTTVKEYNTKNGKRKKAIPLYRDYIFIKYLHTPKMASVLSSCPGMKDYVGKCSDQEIIIMKELTNKKYEDLIPVIDVRVGNSYKLIGTPFKGFTCTVKDKDGSRLIVIVEVFGSDRVVKCSIDDISLEE